jgi:hypothetical protein
MAVWACRLWRQSRRRQQVLRSERVANQREVNRVNNQEREREREQ